LSVLVKPMLSIVTVEKIGEAWAETHEDPDWVHDIWTCACRTCQGRTLEWLASASEANAHTFELLAELRDGVASLTAGRARQRSWTSKCNAAMSRYDELRLGARVGVERTGVPAQLGGAVGAVARSPSWAASSAL
jgi:hypothetical protein